MKRVRNDEGLLNYTNDEMQEVIDMLGDSYEAFKKKGYLNHDFLEFIMVEWHCMLYDDIVTGVLGEKKDK